MESSKQQVIRRLSELRSIRAKYEPTWKGIAEQIMPRRARWSWREAEGSDLTNDKIINNAGPLAARILASGLFAGITSPSRVWFRLTTPDPEMADFPKVKAAIHLTEERMRWIFARSNFYQALADNIYPDLGEFGWGCGIMEEDPRRMMRIVSPAMGEAFLATDENGRVDTLYREMGLTLRQLVRMFVIREGKKEDWSVVSRSVKTLWDRQKFDAIVPVAQAIEPRQDFDPSAQGGAAMPVASRWVEVSGDKDILLRDSGYELFPGLCPRWGVRGNETYSSRCPGMDSLGDCRELQHEERRLSSMIDKTVLPPMKASPEMRGQGGTLRSGDATYLPRTANPIFEPSMTIHPAAIQALEIHVRRIEERIQRAHFEDLWLRVIADDRAQRATAREIEEAHSETMLQLGPVLERLNAELLSPAIDRLYGMMDRAGYLPEFPPELDGVELKVEFISVMHQAQKLTGLAGTRSLIIEVGNVSALKPEALDNLNVDAIVGDLAATIGVKPDYLLTKEEVEKIRADRAKQQQDLMATQAAMASAKATRDVGSVDPALLEQGTLAAGQAAESFGPIASNGIGTGSLQ